MNDDTRRIAEAIEHSGDTALLNRYLAGLHDSLDAAWAEAEEALPEGWAFDLSRAVRPPAEGAAPTYYATVSRPWTTGAIEFQVSGPTPAAALRALAAKLREAQG